ncbi:Neuropeptide Y receptor type [Dirofilaria immitis]
MYSHISKAKNAEQLNAAEVNHLCYDNRKLMGCTDGNKNLGRAIITIPPEIEEIITLHRDDESPLSLSVTDGEYDLECHPSTNLKLNRKHNGDSNNQSPEIFRKIEMENRIAIYLVVFFDRMLNKKQLVIAAISCICGIYATYVAFSRNLSIYGYESRHQSAYTIKTVLFIYGLVQLLLSVIFFFTYSTTKIGHDKWCCYIIRFVGCIVYLLIALIVLLVGIIGFYWVVKLYGHVEYEDRQSADYVDTVLYRSSLFAFTFHICFMLLKCCWWNQ